MTFENLKNLGRLMVPGAKVNRIPDSLLELILNEGAIDVAHRSLCLSSNSKVNIVADQQQYNLSSALTRYLNITEAGVLWNAGDATNTDWRRLKPKTLKWLDEKYSNWRDQDSGTPQYYAIENDTMFIVPAPSASLSDGLWVHYGQKPVAMDSDEKYPFGHDSEISRLSVLSWSILDYWVWKANTIVDKDYDESKGEQDYIKGVESKMKLVNRNRDMAVDRHTKMQGKKVGR